MQAANPHLHEQLAEYLVTLAAQAGRPLTVTPLVQLVADPSIKGNQVSAQVEGSRPTLDDDGGNTQVRVPGRARSSFRKLDNLGAFVIIGGKRHVQLDRSLMTVGRQLNNDIVIDNQTVSRRHAQLRWRYGRYVIYDLGGRQSTAVNGQPVAEHVLQAGDVILLGTASLVYGEDVIEQEAIEGSIGKKRVPNERQESTGNTKPLVRGDKA